MPSSRSQSFRTARQILGALMLVLLSATAASADGWLGIQITPVPQDVVRYYGLPQGIGAYVADVLPGSPADRAGIASGDVLVRIDDELQYSPAILTRIPTSLDVGRTVSVLLFRRDAALTRPVTPTEAPADFETRIATGERSQTTAGLVQRDARP